MGVKDLWTILSPVKSEVSLESLKGQTVAIDLSVWICETYSIKQMQGIVAKPHLRNLFFRVQHLLHLGITPVFVIDGEAPELKWETILKRTQARLAWRGKGRGKTTVMSVNKKPGRVQFKSRLKECCSLLHHMGVAHVQAEGEAEAMCAFLNQQGLVDGVITEDGDAFLYGALTVFRNFSINGKNPEVECYKMVDVETNLNIDREGLVSMGLLLGCDFCPKGVPGVGKEMALKLAEALKGENILERFQSWTDGTAFEKLYNLMTIKKVAHCTTCKHPGSSKEHTSKGCGLCGSLKYCEPQSYDYECRCTWHAAQKKLRIHSAELAVRKKALEVGDFPNQKVIDEFMKTRNALPKKSLKWGRPEKISIQKFAFEKMEWPEEYTEGKIVPLMTLWDMKNIQERGRFNASMHLQPNSIVKTRVRQGIQSYEVLWCKIDDDRTTESEFYTTIEDQEMFSFCFPNVVCDFESTSNSKRNQKKGKKKSSKSSTSDQLENVAKYLPNLLDDESDVIYGSQTKSRAKSQRKEIGMKERASLSGDIAGCSINEKVKRIGCERNQSRNEIRDGKKRASSDTSNMISGGLLSNAYGDIDPAIRLEDLEEADLLALPLSQRLRLRSLQSASSGASQPQKPACSKIAPHSFSSDSDEERLLEEQVDPQPLPNDPFDDQDEIISGLLDHKAEFGSKVEQEQYFVCEIKKDHLSHVDEFVNEIASMNIADDDEPTLKLTAREQEKDLSTILCTETTATVCLDVDSSNSQSRIISNAMSNGTIVTDSTATRTVYLEVGDDLPVPRNSFEDRLLGVTHVANTTDTVCIEISEKDEGHFAKQSNEADTNHCQIQDLTNTQLIYSDDTLHCGTQVTRQTSNKSKMLRPPSNSYNVTRGCFDLNPDFTVSVSETSAIDCSGTDMTLKVSESPSSEASNLRESDKNDSELNVMECASNVDTVLIGDDYSKERQKELSVEFDQNFTYEQDTRTTAVTSVDEHRSLISDQIGNEFDNTNRLVYDEEHTVYLNVQNTPAVSRKPYTVACAPDTTVYVDVCNVDSFCETTDEGKFAPYAAGGFVVEQTAYKGTDEVKSSSTKLSEEIDFGEAIVVNNSCTEMDISLECSLGIECRNNNSCPNRYEQDIDMDVDVLVVDSHQHDTSQMGCCTLDVAMMNSKRDVSSSQPTDGYSNQAARSNFMIESSLLNYSLNKTEHMEMNSCSSKSSDSLLFDNSVVDDLDKCSNKHEGHFSDSEDEEIKRNKKLNSKQVNKGLKSLPGVCASKVNTEESLLQLVDNVISSQVPKKRNRQKKFKREDLENLLFEDVSQGNDISLLDLVNDVISSTQGTKATIKVKKTKKLKCKKNKKLRSLQNIDPNVFS